MTKAKTLKQDKRNYRKHSERNKELIRKSIDEAGFGRSVVVDADGVLIAGNGVCSVIDPETPTRIIETTGDELIVVKRTDLHQGDERRNRLAMADNATADHVEWDFDALQQDFDLEQIGRFDIEFEEVQEKKTQKAETVDLKPFCSSHILISYKPERHDEIIERIKPFLDDDEIEILQSSN